jgi:hypothetical protein
MSEWADAVDPKKAPPGTNTEGLPPVGWVREADGSYVPPTRTGTNPAGRSKPRIGDSIRDQPEGLSVGATYADAILAAKRHLDAVEESITTGQAANSFDNRIALAEAWSALAYACQKPPGSRF